jgi:hypothetical protein
MILINPWYLPRTPVPGRNKANYRFNLYRIIPYTLLFSWSLPGRVGMPLNGQLLLMTKWATVRVKERVLTWLTRTANQWWHEF